jgi:hypothetical protein
VDIVKLESETVATAPYDRNRKTIGVGEEVELRLDPSSISPVTWSISGDGTLSAGMGNAVIFTAHDQASSPTITANFAGHECSVDFNVIQPSGVLFENVGPMGWGCPPAQTWIGGNYMAQVYIQPDTVNFYNIQLYESHAVAQKTEYFHDKDILDHPNNGPHNITGYIYGKGSSLEHLDFISGSASPPPYSSGTVVWSIDWKYNIGAGEKLLIQTVDQIYSLYVDEYDQDDVIFRIEKGDSGYHIRTTVGAPEPN